MAGTSSEGVGQGSVTNIYPKILNDVVKTENLASFGFTGLVELVGSNTNSLTIRSGPSDGGSDDNAQNLNLLGGTGNSTGDNDGGDVNVIGGAGNGSGEGGSVYIAGGVGGPTSSYSEDVTIEGGYGAYDEVDGGGVYIYGGPGSNESGDSGNGGEIYMAAGQAANGGGDGGDFSLYAGEGHGNGNGGDFRIEAGNYNGNESSSAGSVEIYAGYVAGDGTSAGTIIIRAGDSYSSKNVTGGDITIQSGVGTVNGRGGDLNLIAGNSVGTDRAGDINLSAGNNSGAGREGHVYLNSMPRMPVYVDNTARDLAAGTATEGMFCYNTATNNVEFYINGAWKSVDVTAIV